MRIIAANEIGLVHPYTQINNGKSVGDLPYFSIEQHTIDKTSNVNKNLLRSNYEDYLLLIKLINQIKADTEKPKAFSEYMDKYSQVNIGILTKRVENQNTLVTLLNPKYFTAKFGISVVNIFEEFDFKALQVNLKVVLETKSKLTTTEVLELSEKIDGQMSDGWGEEYHIEEVNEFHDVTGWQYDNKTKNLLVESTHNIYYPKNKILKGS